MSAVKRMRDKEPRHVRLYHWLTDTEAWRDLDCVARCVYLQLARRYGGPDSNNGRIPYSLTEIADDLGVSKPAAAETRPHSFGNFAGRGEFPHSGSHPQFPRSAPSTSKHRTYRDL